MTTRSILKNLKVLLSGVLFVIGGVLIVTPIIFVVVGLFLLKVVYDRITIEKIKWAPIRLPIKRRLQTLGIFFIIVLSFLLAPALIIINLILMYYLGNFERVVIISYWIYTYYDHYANFSTTDGLGSKLLRTSIVTHYARAYFPVELIKTVDLKPDKNYLFACFPHGILSFGPIINMGMEIDKWLTLFPGIRPKVATLDVNFCVPFRRQSLRAYGFVSVSKESLLHYLCKSNNPMHIDNQDGFTSNAIAVSVGGAKEASDTYHGQYKLTLKNRKGFIKIAIISGASIVPTFTFNENDLFEQIIGKEGSLLHRFQYYAKKLFGIWPTIIVGRGFFQYSFGILPQRRRLVQVVGAPIEVKQCETPDAAYIDEIHQRFVSAITELFENHKTKYSYSEGAELIIT